MFLISVVSSLPLFFLLWYNIVTTASVMVASTSNISRRNTPTAANIAFDSLPTLPVLDVGGVEYGVSVLKRATTDGSLKLGDGNATVVIEGLAAILMTGKASCVDEGDSKESFIVLDT